MSGRTVHYVLGHGPAELARLERQAAIFAAPTRAMLERAGITPGMRVLDVGCGAGDVSLLVADLVGPTGQVVGVDRAPEAVATARRRTAGRRGATVTIVESTLEALDIPPVDAVVGRFVLMHQPAPAAALARAASFLRPGGVVAIMESHLDALPGWHSSPPSEAYGQVLELMLRIIRAAGGRTDMGLRLRATFLEAGLPDPALDVHVALAGRDADRMARYMADSLRSMAPVADRLGVATLTDDAINAVERTLLADAALPGVVFNGPVVMTAWSRR